MHRLIDDALAAQDSLGAHVGILMQRFGTEEVWVNLPHRVERIEAFVDTKKYPGLGISFERRIECVRAGDSPQVRQVTRMEYRLAGASQLCKAIVFTVCLFCTHMYRLTQHQSSRNIKSLPPILLHPKSPRCGGWSGVSPTTRSEEDIPEVVLALVAMGGTGTNRGGIDSGVCGIGEVETVCGSGGVPGDGVRGDGVFDAEVCQKTPKSSTALDPIPPKNPNNFHS